MKKLAFSLLLLAGTLSVKAQQPPSEKSKAIASDTVKYDQGLFVPRNMSVKELEGYLKNIDGNMPVARMQGRSKMPIVKTDQTGYTMPVAGKDLKGVYYMKKDSVIAHP